MVPNLKNIREILIKLSSNVIENVLLNRDGSDLTLDKRLHLGALL